MLIIRTPVFKDGVTDGYLAGIFDTQRLFASILDESLLDDHSICVYLTGKPVFTDGDRPCPERAAVMHENGEWSGRDIKIEDDVFSVAVSARQPVGSLSFLKSVSGQVLIFGTFGSFLLMTTFFLGQTARRRSRESESARRAAARSEAGFRALLDATPDAMLTVNEEGRIMTVNAEAETLFGYTRDELQWRETKELLSDHASIPAEADGDATLFPEKEQPESMESIGIRRELYGKRKDGTEFPAELSLGYWTEEDGRDVVVAAIRDVTERKEAERILAGQQVELERSNGELERFAYVASHDLQEPLRMVSAYTQLLAKRYKGKLGTDADEYIAFAVDGALRMQALINDLLAYSRIGRAEVPAKKTSLQDALQEAVFNLRGTIEETGATILCPQPLPQIRGNHRLLVQLFQNLLSNGLKFHGEAAPSIVIRLVKAKQEWIVSVADNGIGIDPKFFDRIFTVFQRLHTKSEYPGTGIGLALCLRIVQRHGGRMWVDSQPDSGTIFSFAMPRQTRSMKGHLD